jgi:response regulator RpfG family c-di-GMP phosphodiesterase
MPEKKKILIVDDEESIRGFLRRRLSKEGFRCQEASSAHQALDKLRSSPVDLVILDIKMPGKPGTELLPQIKTSYPDTAVIMATAITDTNIAVQCMKQGAYDYLTKPFNLDEVIMSANRALETKRLELENREYQQHLEERVKEQAEKIRSSFLNAIAALVYALEAKDKYTSGHSQRVTQIAIAIAQELGMSPDSINKIQFAGLVHDIGKIGVRESVLDKPGKLTEEEFQDVKRHCEIGERILTPIADDEDINQMVRHHHELYDGTGYPDGLKGESIPLGARVLAVADTFDAMTSDRPYRPAVSVNEALNEISKYANTQFDPAVVAAFLKIPVAEIMKAEMLVH